MKLWQHFGELHEMDRSYGLQAIGPDTTDFTRMFPELILSNREDMK